MHKEVILMKIDFSGYFEDINNMWHKYEKYRIICEEIMNSDMS